MATFSRKALKAMGIEDEKIDSIIEMHTDVTEALKADRDTYKQKAEKFDDVQKELNTANDKLAKYGKEGETVSKADYDRVKGEYEAYKAEQTAKETRTAKVSALRAWLKGIGISEKRLDSIVKVTNLDEIRLDKDGKIEDADTRAEAAKTEWADFIETTITRGANIANPPANNGGNAKSKDEIFKMENGKFVYSASERQGMLAKLEEAKG